MGRKWWKKKRKQQVQARQKGTQVAQPVAATQPWTPSKPCHDGVVGVFKKDRVFFWGGKARDVHQWHDWDLVICFSDRDSQWEDNDPKPSCTFNHSARELLSPELFIATPRSPFIGVDWPDYQQPDINREWWEILLRDIHRIDKEEINVALCCTGGHGRTGTALAVLHGLSWPDALEDPVELIRRVYCSNCVESLQQLKYISEITGRPIKAKPAFTPGPQGSARSGYYSQYEIGDNKAQGSASGTKLAELETAASLNQNRSMVEIVKKAASIGEEDIWQREDFIPFGADQMKHGFTYQPITNAAGDIIGWSERKDVAI